MNKKYDIHEDFAAFEKVKLRGMNPCLLSCFNGLATILSAVMGIDKNVSTENKKITSYDGAEVKLSIYTPASIGEKAPCLVYFHGGGFCLKGMPGHFHRVIYYALNVPCKVVFVHYRLAPKYPFPKGVEDCYSALLWTLENAGKLGVDANKIAVCGDSAGGALAAAVSQMARDRKGPKVCFQMMIYPVTDCDQATESMKSFDDTPLWNARLNHKMWEYYLKNGDYGMLPYAAPIKAGSLEGLPLAYIETAEYDCLRDEGINYAKALRKAGVKVWLEETKRTIHGYDDVQESSITKQSMEKRIKALREGFGV